MRLWGFAALSHQPPNLSSNYGERR
jgi:hypothetical protein